MSESVPTTITLPPMMFATTLLPTDATSVEPVVPEDDDGWRVIVAYSKFYIEGVGIMSVGTIGLFINVFALYILLKKKVMRNFHLLMCSLAVYDFFHLILDIVCFALPEFSSLYRNNVLLHAIPFVIPITQITLTGSCYTTIAITIERFLSIRFPFFIQRHNVKAKLFIVPVIVYALVYNIPRFFEFIVVSRCDWQKMPNATAYNGSYPEDCQGLEDVHFYSLGISDMRRDPLYITVYVNSMNLSFNMIIPFVTMGIMNYMIYRAMSRSHRLTQSSITTFRSSNTNLLSVNKRVGSRQNQRSSTLQRSASSLLLRSSSRSQSQPQQNLRRSCENVLRKREARITRASIAITIMFVFCHVPRCIPNIMEMFMTQKESPKWLPILVHVNHLLIAVNSALNFLFYVSYCWSERKQARLSIPGTQTTTTTLANGGDWVEELTETALSSALASHTNHRILNSIVSCQRGQYGALLHPRMTKNSLSASDLGQICSPSPQRSSQPLLSDTRRMVAGSRHEMASEIPLRDLDF